MGDLKEQSHDMGMHTETLKGRTQQRFFSPAEEENFLYPWAYDVDIEALITSVHSFVIRTERLTILVGLLACAMANGNPHFPMLAIWWRKRNTHIFCKGCPSFPITSSKPILIVCYRWKPLV